MRRVCPCCGFGTAICGDPRCKFTAEITRWKACPKRKHGDRAPEMRCYGCSRMVSETGRGIVQILDAVERRILPWRIVP